ncbi:MAG: DUF3228 family protein [Candidatus Marinimicrobia bacterium]|nr:DUF3228 family protein [Candidatus Neomarinimicrobiota bacterium]
MGSINIAVNPFARRQIKGSGKTYSPSLTFEEIANHAEQRLAEGHVTKGYRDGVVLVSVAEDMIKHFVCPFVKIDESTKLKAEIVRRRDDEKPYIQIRALNGDPLIAGKVELILYRHDVLVETNEQSCNAEWELISIHAIPQGVDKFPMGYVTMMRNQLELPGGTRAMYSSDEWAESVYFWQKYAALISGSL